MTKLPSLRPGLLRHRLENELLVYDSREEQIHLLNPAAFAVVEMMDEGLDADTIATRLAKQNGSASGSEMLALALDELAKAKLIETKSEVGSASMLDGTRRQMIQKAAAVGAALLLPAIITLAPRAAAAATNIATGSPTPCAHNFECQSLCCASNGSGTCTQSRCSPNTCGNCTP
jgi:hypothetical protein